MTRPDVQVLTENPVDAAFVTDYWLQHPNGLFVHTYKDLAKEYGFREKNVGSLIRKFCRASIPGATCVDCGGACVVANRNEYFLARRCVIENSVARCGRCVQEFKKQQRHQQEQELQSRYEQEERSRLAMQARFGPGNGGLLTPSMLSLRARIMLLSMVEAGLWDSGRFSPVSSSKWRLTHHPEFTQNLLIQLLRDGIVGYDPTRGMGPWIGSEAVLFHREYLFGLTFTLGGSTAEAEDCLNHLSQGVAIANWSDKWVYEAQNLMEEVAVGELWRIFLMLCEDAGLGPPSTAPGDYGRFSSALQHHSIAQLSSVLSFCVAESKVVMVTKDGSTIARAALESMERLLGHARACRWTIPNPLVRLSHFASALGTVLFGSGDALCHCSLGVLDHTINARLRLGDGG